MKKSKFMVGTTKKSAKKATILALTTLMLGNHANDAAAQAAFADMNLEYTDENIYSMADPFTLQCTFDDSSDGDIYA